MAYKKKNTTTNDEQNVATTSETVNEPDVTSESETNVETSDESDIVNKAENNKEFSPSDLIPCVSITPGEMFVVGNKSQTLYTFADMDDVIEIEFRDLDYAARSKDAMMYKPRFIVQNSDFVALHPALDQVYSSLHSTKDLKEILKMSPTQMEKVIKSLPEGAKESIKTIAATMVDNGTLDSIQCVKTLDSIFNTDMLLKLTSMN